MKRIFTIALLLCAALVAGILAGEGFCRAEFARRIVALIAQRTGLFLNGPAAQALVREENLRGLSRGEVISPEEIERSVDLLRFQFADDNAFARALSLSDFTFESLRAQATEHLRAQRWIERKIAPDLEVDVTSVRRFYDENPARFAQPQRFRVSHIFLAAPEGYPEEVIAAKQSAIQGLSVRILAGEKFDDLEREASEDEATKSKGGDLGYFSAWRMPREFMAELEKMQVDEISAPIRSHLGFHLVRLTDVKPPREMSFEETQREIALLIKNEKRAGAVARLSEELNAQ
ncbi:MAG: peptidylprolyl isomerase [Chthoniobacterales bacterium]